MVLLPLHNIIRGESKPPFQSELIENVDVFNIHLYDIFHMYNHWKQYPCCTKYKQKEIGKIRNESYRYFTPRFHTQQPPLKYSVMYGYSMM